MELPVLALLRREYLRAKPPQQIKELKELFNKIGTATASVSSTPAEVSSSSVSSIRSASRTTTTPARFEEMKRDLDDKTSFGSDVGAGAASSAAADDGSVRNRDNKTGDCLGSAVGGTSNENVEVDPNPEDFFSALYDTTLLGCSNEDMELGEDFCHPPIQYRIAFAKYVIKQLESCKGNASVPQGSHEEDEGDPTENQQQQTLLEKWYDGLELQCSRQVLSEPFYRLYEIKVSHCPGKGTGGKEVVKIFENETSFVADGTTGLVTWEASTEFLKWLGSPAGQTRVSPEGVKWILELGCGCGFLAVAVTKCLQSLEQYIATDGSLSALEKAKLNVDANFSMKHTNRMLHRKVRFEKVDWQDETRESFTQLVDGMTNIHGIGTGILLGADIVFDRELIPDLVELITLYVEAGAGKAIISCTIRNEETIEVLRQQFDSSQGLTIVSCGTWENGEILEITRS